MFGIGVPELMVILVVALVVLGPRRLPEMAKVLGKALAELRRATADLTDELHNAREMLEEEVRQAEHPARDNTEKKAGGDINPPPELSIRSEPAAVPAATSRVTKEPASGDPQ